MKDSRLERANRLAGFIEAWSKELKDAPLFYFFVKLIGFTYRAIRTVIISTRTVLEYTSISLRDIFSSLESVVNIFCMILSVLHLFYSRLGYHLIDPIKPIALPLLEILDSIFNLLSKGILILLVSVLDALKIILFIHIDLEYLKQFSDSLFFVTIISLLITRSFSITDNFITTEDRKKAQKKQNIYDKKNPPSRSKIILCLSWLHKKVENMNKKYYWPISNSIQGKSCYVNEKGALIDEKKVLSPTEIKLLKEKKLHVLYYKNHLRRTIGMSLTSFLGWGLVRPIGYVFDVMENIGRGGELVIIRRKTMMYLITSILLTLLVNILLHKETLETIEEIIR